MTNSMTEIVPLPSKKVNSPTYSAVEKHTPADFQSELLPFRSQSSTSQDSNFSDATNLVILRMLGSICNELPIEIEISSSKSDHAQQCDPADIWRWLSDQGIVAGSIDNGELTAAGRASLEAVTGNHLRIDAVLKSSAADRGECRATELVLALLRHHYLAGQAC